MNNNNTLMNRALARVKTKTRVHRAFNRLVTLVPPPKFAVGFLLTHAINRAKREHIGVGTAIKQWTESIGISSHQGCKCRALAEDMDKKGIEYVEKFYEDYLNKMVVSIRGWRHKTDNPITQEHFMALKDK